MESSVIRQYDCRQSDNMDTDSVVVNPWTMVNLDCVWAFELSATDRSASSHTPTLFFEAVDWFNVQRLQALMHLNLELQLKFDYFT